MSDQDLSLAAAKEQADAAYDVYLDGIDDLAGQFGISPPSPRLVQDDPRTHAAAAQLFATFRAEKDRIDAEYFAPRDARALEREKAESAEDKALVRLAQARENLAQAQNNFWAEQGRISAMRGAGIVVTAAEADHIIATAQAQVDHWQAVVDRLNPE